MKQSPWKCVLNSSEPALWTDDFGLEVHGNITHVGSVLGSYPGVGG